jgi:hypothetical protein
MDEFEANMWFCQHSMDAKKVFRNEKNHAEVDWGGSTKGHFRKCTDFNKKYSNVALVAKKRRRLLEVAVSLFSPSGPRVGFCFDLGLDWSADKLGHLVLF